MNGAILDGAGLLARFAALHPVAATAIGIHDHDARWGVEGAKGDFVWLIWEREEKDPRNPANTYHYNTFDVVRLENGKIQEHWDSAQKAAPQPAGKQ